MEVSIPLHRLSLITDGRAAMMGSVNGFNALCEDDGSFLNFMSYYCIIHKGGVC
jgi:hypothetical protein